MAKQSQSKTDLAVAKPHLFQPGQSGNPAGRSPGTRVRLSEKYLQRLADHFDEHGMTALDAACQINPVGYLGLIGKLLPKNLIAELTVGNGALDLDASRRAKIAEEWIMSREESNHG